MNIFQLTCFLTVAETLNFARTAERLHVTQPAVTQQIHSLEKELNTVLFRRTTRSVKITPEGLSFLDDARQMVLLADRAKRRFEEPQSKRFQVFSLGCGSTSLLNTLTPALEELRIQFPNLHPRIQTMPGPHLYRQLEEGDLDAVADLRVSTEKKTPLHYREIRQVPLVCLVPHSHPLANRDTLTEADLRKEKLVLLDPTVPQPNALRPTGQMLEDRPLADMYFCQTAEAVLALVIAGYGVAVFPDLFPDGDLPFARVPLSGPKPVSLGIYYRSVQGNEPLKFLLRILRPTHQDTLSPS